MGFFITAEQVLQAYIRTGARPLHGAQSYVLDPVEGEAICACPIGVLCLDKGVLPDNIESGTFGEFFYDLNSHSGNICWVDGFVSGWEETAEGVGFSPQGYSYTEEENPEGLELYRRGYQNGQHIRQEFIRLGLRAA